MKFTVKKNKTKNSNETLEDCESNKSGCLFGKKTK